MKTLELDLLGTLALATLLPIINPLSSAPVFAATVGSNRAIAEKLARQVAINAWFVLVASMLIGTYVLAPFGISIPVVRIGGGLLVAAGGAALVSVVLYLAFRNSVAVLARPGKIGTLVLIRLMAFILPCIGIEIIWTGWAELNGQ